MNWRIKMAAKLLLARLPVPHRVWQSLRLFRHGEMDNAQYTLGIFRRHCTTIVESGELQGATLLELGPGDGIATGLLAHLHGARSTILIDSGDFAVRSIDTYRKMLLTWSELGLETHDLVGCADFDTLCQKASIRYLTGGLDSLQGLEAGSVDFSFSHAVLEHVRKGEFARTAAALRLAHRSGGWSRHVVDLTDHLGGGLNNLRFSESLWESKLFSEAGFYTNRLRCAEMVQIFEDSGFAVELSEIRRWQQLPINREVIDESLRRWSDEELRVSGFDLEMVPSGLNENVSG